MTRTTNDRTFAYRSFAALVLLAGAAVMQGCNTVEGLGDDLKSASQSTREAFSDDDKATSTTSGTEGQGSAQTQPK